MIKLSKKIMGGVLLLIVSLVFYFQIPKGFNLSWSLPRFYSIITILLSAGLVVSGLIGWKKDDKDKITIELKTLKHSEIWKVIAFMAMLLCYYALISVLGMVVSTVLFIIALYLFLGTRDLKTIAVGLLAFGAVYCVFAFGLHVRFPHGILY